MRTMLQQRPVLCGRWRKPKPHASTLRATTDISRSERCFLSALKTGVSI
jgi:hypothetical protein